MAEDGEGDGTESDEVEIRQSADSFRRAGSAVGDGISGLYYGCQAWVNRRHSLVQFAIGMTIWFGANWTYNRIAPPIIDVTFTLFGRVSSGFASATTFDVLGKQPVLASVQILIALVAVVVAQNRRQTRILTTMEDKLTIMSKEPAPKTDGGTPERRPTIAWAIGLAIAGGSLGFSFGPGGILAGIYFGLLIGGKLDRRAYERDLHTPSLNTESRTKR